MNPIQFKFADIIDVAGHGIYHWHLHRVAAFLAYLEEMHYLQASGRHSERLEGFFKFFASLTGFNHPAAGPAALGDMIKQLGAIVAELAELKEHFLARVAEQRQGHLKSLHLGEASFLIKKSDGKGGILHQDLLLRTERAFLMPIIQQDPVLVAPLFQRTRKSVEGMLAEWFSLDLEAAAALKERLSFLTVSALAGMEMPLSVAPAYVRKNLVNAGQGAPGSLLVLDGHCYHATPATIVPEHEPSFRASFYCALVDAPFHKKADIKLYGNDYQWRVLDAIKLLTDDLSKLKDFQKRLKQRDLEFFRKLVSFTVLLARAEREVVPDLLLETYLKKTSFLAMCQEVEHEDRKAAKTKRDAISTESGKATTKKKNLGSK